MAKRKKNILMITDSSFPADVRIRQEAFTLKDNGYNVSIISAKSNGLAFFQNVEGVNVYRIPKVEIFKKRKHFKGKAHTLLNSLFNAAMGVIGYGFEFCYFTFSAFILSFFVWFKHNFDIIHTHNPPDTLFAIALFYKLFGKKFVYDHHDLSADLYVEKYRPKIRLIYNILLFLEKISCKTADYVIATNESYKSIEVERSRIKLEKVYVVRNGPDLTKLQIVEGIDDIRKRANTILCYLGAINVQDGVDNVLYVLDKIVHTYNYRDIFLVVIGDGDYLFKIKSLACQLKIEKYILFTGFIGDVHELNKYLSTADIFLDAAPSSFLNDNSTFIKIMEYMVFRKAIVSFDLRESSISLKDAGLLIPLNDVDRMAQAVIDLIKDEKTKNKLAENAAQRVKELSWDRVSVPLLELYRNFNA